MVSSFAPMYQNFYTKAEDSYKKLDAQRVDKEETLNQVKSQIAALEHLEKSKSGFTN